MCLKAILTPDGLKQVLVHDSVIVVNVTKGSNLWHVRQERLSVNVIWVEKLKESEAQLQNTVNAQDHQLKKALAKPSKPSEREAALKRRIASLENLVEYYKNAKFSSNIEPPENTPSEYGKEAILKEED